MKNNPNYDGRLLLAYKSVDNIDEVHFHFDLDFRDVCCTQSNLYID